MELGVLLYSHSDRFFPHLLEHQFLAQSKSSGVIRVPPTESQRIPAPQDGLFPCSPTYAAHCCICADSDPLSFPTESSTNSCSLNPCMLNSMCRHNWVIITETLYTRAKVPPTMSAGKKKAELMLKKLLFWSCLCLSLYQLWDIPASWDTCVDFHNKRMERRNLGGPALA